MPSTTPAVQLALFKQQFINIKFEVEKFNKLMSIKDDEEAQIGSVQSRDGNEDMKSPSRIQPNTNGSGAEEQGNNNKDSSNKGSSSEYSDNDSSGTWDDDIGIEKGDSEVNVWSDRSSIKIEGNEEEGGKEEDDEEEYDEEEDDEEEDDEEEEEEEGEEEDEEEEEDEVR
jgi:hypothetical protein